MEKYIAILAFYGYSTTVQESFYNYIEKTEEQTILKNLEKIGITLEKIKNACRIIESSNIKYITKCHPKFKDFFSRRKVFVIFFWGMYEKIFDLLDETKVGIISNQVLSSTGKMIIEKYVYALLNNKISKVLMFEKAMIEYMKNNNSCKNIFFMSQHGLKKTFDIRKKIFKLEQKNIIIFSFSPYYKNKDWNYFDFFLYASLIGKLIIVEMKQKSYLNMLIDICLNMDIDIMTFPGNVFSKAFAGNNKLILDGANIVLSEMQLLKYFEVK